MLLQLCYCVNIFLASSTSYPELGIDALATAWNSTSCHSDEEWVQWIKRLAEELIRQAPFAILQKCYPLAQVRNCGFLASVDYAHMETSIIYLRSDQIRVELAFL